MTLDEQMAAIEQLVGPDGGVVLPWEWSGVFIEDADKLGVCECHTDATRDDMAYLVACANAAPDLCKEVRRLREELQRVQLQESLLSRVVSAAEEFVREIDPENPEENDPSTIIRVIDEWHKTKPW